MGAGHDHSHGAGDRPDRGLRNRLALAFAITVGIVAALHGGAVLVPKALRLRREESRS